MKPFLEGLWHCENWKNFATESYVYFSNDDQIYNFGTLSFEGAAQWAVERSDANYVSAYEVIGKFPSGTTFSLLVRFFSEDTAYFYRGDTPISFNSWIGTRTTLGATQQTFQAYVNRHPRLPQTLKST